MNQKRIGREVRKLNLLIARKFDAHVLSKHGNVTLTQYLTIDFLNTKELENIEVFQKDLEKELDIQRAAVSLMLKNMEKSGLIEREVSSKDARQKKLIATQKAKDLRIALINGFDKVEALYRQGLTEEEREFFFSIIDRVRDNLSKI